MVMRTQPTLFPGMSSRIAEAAALSPSSFRGELGEENTEEDEEDESSDADDERESQGLDDEGHGLGDESQGLEDEGLSLEEAEEEEEVAPEGQQQVVLVVDTATGEPLGLGYRAARRCALESIDEISPSTYEVDPEDDRVYIDIPAYSPPAAPVQAPPSPEWSLGSLPISPSFPIVPSPIASLVAILIATISVDEDQFIEILIGMSLEREQERTAMTFRALWRPMLALEAWAGHVDTWLADTSQDRYDDHRLIHDMLVQQAAMQRKLQEMRGRVAALE
ncbi:hypothetical protein Tco_0734530 [Tanacetum coccineum]